MELGALGVAGRVKSLSIGAVAAAVLTVTTPEDDEVAGSTHRHAWKNLIFGGVGVDIEFGALSYAGSVKSLCVDAKGGSFLVSALPGDDKVTCVVHRDITVFMAPGGQDASPELRALGHTCGIITLGIDA